MCDINSNMSSKAVDIRIPSPSNYSAQTFAFGARRV